MVHIRVREDELRKLLAPMPYEDAVWAIISTLQSGGIDTSNLRAIRFVRRGNDAHFYGPSAEAT